MFGEPQREELVLKNRILEILFLRRTLKAPLSDFFMVNSATGVLDGERVNLWSFSVCGTFRSKVMSILEL